MAAQPEVRRGRHRMDTIGRGRSGWDKGSRIDQKLSASSGTEVPSFTNRSESKSEGF